MEKINPLKYLPEIYMKEGSFTERFLSIFTDIYCELEKEIDDSADLYNPELCPREFVEWLGEWIAAENIHLFPDDRKRELLLAIPRLSIYRGTVRGLKELLEIYCGAKVFIVECYHTRRYYSSRAEAEAAPGASPNKDIARLYSGGRFAVWILSAPTKNKIDELEKIVESQLPANITAKIKLLVNITELNNYCYLGVNPVLAGTHRGFLDGKCALNSSVVLTGAEAEAAPNC